MYPGQIVAKELTKETAHEYLLLLGVEKNLKATYEVMLNPLMDGVLKGVAQGVAKQGLSQQKAEAAINAMRPHVQAAKNELLANLHNLMPMKDLEEKIYLPVLRESFSDEELKEVNTFLKTPIGRKYSQQLMPVMQKSAQASQSLFGPKIEQFFSSAMAKRREQAVKEITAAIENTR